jgi:murein DD-endopeptidase MepM/ murein hydrolase activator NlpD
LLLFVFLPVLLGAEYQTHKVVRGDTLYSLSKRYGVTVDQLMKLNNLPDSRLSINQVLRIKEIKPAPVPAPKPADTASPALTPVPAPGPQAVAETGDLRLPADYYYTVQAKDNLYRISVNNNLALKDLLDWNDFEDVTHTIHPGDRLVIKDPSTYEPGETQEDLDPGADDPALQAKAAADTVVVQRIYVVQKKDTLYKIATQNGMTVEELKRINNLTSNDLKVGQVLYLAGAPPAGSAAASVKPLTEEDIEQSDRIRTDLILPVTGRISSEYGLRNGRPHKGLDISAKTGTPIYAVLDGVVVFSGYQGAYGNVVVLEHPDFVMTVYAHNESNVVKVNDVVKQGQLIAYLGATGDATGPHVHFEYRLKGKAINPRKVLPLD